MLDIRARTGIEFQPFPGGSHPFHVGVHKFEAVDEKRLAAFSVAWQNLVPRLRTGTQPRNLIEFQV